MGCACPRGAKVCGMKDTNFYNKESFQYSDKRYPKIATSYTQFFFKRRLDITKQYMSRIVQKMNITHILEIGCADGVVVRALDNAFPHVFGKITGIDLSSCMIEEARRRNVSPKVSFFERKEYQDKESFHIIVEIGVVNYARFEEELAFALEHLSKDGYYILSVAGTNSLLNILKPERGFSDFRSYEEYERLIQEKFSIVSVRGCGFFVPFLWRIPFLARFIQPYLDMFAGMLIPSVCHEKVYLLQKQ